VEVSSYGDSCIMQFLAQRARLFKQALLISYFHHSR
jgi:hypothetical protein